MVNLHFLILCLLSEPTHTHTNKPAQPPPFCGSSLPWSPCICFRNNPKDKIHQEPLSGWGWGGGLLSFSADFVPLSRTIPHLLSSTLPPANMNLTSLPGSFPPRSCPGCAVIISFIYWNSIFWQLVASLLLVAIVFTFLFYLCTDRQTNRHNLRLNIQFFLPLLLLLLPMS